MKHWLREPFFHVLWIGLLLVTGYRSQGAALGLPKPSAVPQLRQGASVSPKVSFRQLFFPLGGEGGNPQERAVRALKALSVDPDSAEAINQADHSRFSSYYSNSSREQLISLFGPQFTDSVFGLKTGAWRGPIKSAHGWHLVWVDSIKGKDRQGG